MAQKTRKAMTKRIKVTGRKKVMRRKTGIGHFGAKKSGKETRSGRKTVQFAPADRKKIREMIPSL